MSEFKYYIPTERLPKHVNHDILVRGVREIPPVFNDFKPTFVANPIKFQKFLDGSVFEDIGEYSLSVFNTVDSFENFFKNRMSPSFNSKIIGYAIGHSNINIGITSDCDEYGHINYYLYDYENDIIMKDFCKYEHR